MCKPGWRNGIRGSLKNCWPQGLESSNLSLGTNFVIISCMVERNLSQSIDVIWECLPSADLWGGTFEVTLKQQGKRLILYIYSERNTFNTHIANTKDQNAMPGTTTQLYTQAFSLMTNVVNKTNQPWTYEFATKYESMRNWALAQDKGMQIFNWDDTEHTPEGIFIAKKTLTPSKSQKID